MKRKEPPAAQRSRRQPQTSCDSCRKKKLKCDRGVPCASCVVRGLDCTGQSVPRSLSSQRQLSAENGSNSSILARLQRLEQAVFGVSVGRDGEAETKIQGRQAIRARDRIDSTSSPASTLNNERQQTAKFLDSTYTGRDSSVVQLHGKMDFRVTTATQLARTPLSTTTDGTLNSCREAERSTWLMTREEALLLLQDFIDNPYHLLPIIHKSSTQLLIGEFYTRLSHGKSVDPAHAALILSISASGAYFFNENASSHHMFASSEDAVQASQTWLQSAMDILNEPQQTVSGRLEEIQARVLLSYFVYNLEGCSALFRFLHSCSLAVARDACLHLIDSPETENHDDAATREIKRRLWWHLASTDWMIGLAGGPLDGTYAVHPEHMNVNYPRNINDSDLDRGDDALTFPPDVATETSIFNHRIRLGEISRAVVDARPSGRPDTEVTDYDRILALDRLFTTAMAEFPPFLRDDVDGPVPAGAPRHFALQRAIIHLGFHSRRARLHRPFLVHDYARDDDRYRQSRDICLGSARKVLAISMPLLEGRGEGAGERPLIHRLGTVIGHMFVACTVLALNAGISAPRGGTAGAENADGSDTVAERHAELARACRALAAAGKESTVAARMVRSLTDVLRRYRVQGVDDVVVLDNDGQDAEAEPAMYRAEAGPSRGAGGMENHDASEPVDGENDGNVDGLWSDFLNTMPMTDGWDQLFAGLDSYCGPT